MNTNNFKTFKFTIFILMILLINSLCAFFHFFEENPAMIADRNHKEFYFPLLSNQINFNNNLLQFDDIRIFQKGRVMKESEKEKLTKDDVNLEINAKLDALSFGYKNWNLSYSLIGFADIELLEKEYAKLIFYGNDQDSYKTTNGEGSGAAIFSKTSLTYAYHKPIFMKFLEDKKFDSEKLDKVIGFISEMPIYLGGRLNIYYSNFYAYVPLSEQEFGSSYLETYGNYKLRYYFSDKDTNKDFSLGIGMGLKAKLPQGWFYLHLDDLFASLSYNNLKAEYQEGVFQDSLTHLEEGYELESETVSEEYRINAKNIRLSPYFDIGYVHDFSKLLKVVARYKTTAYEFQDGFSLGINYDFFDYIPFQFTVGREENFYFETKTGIKLSNFEYMLSSTFYSGMFRYAKGIGFKMGIKYKF
ncbi:MAG: hypothetical protein K8S23_05945 [Candidatus Cloacimonetes bacterium]|nr:hypothetical protein [Candidatus Cloacimonadota bacterium]